MGRPTLGQQERSMKALTVGAVRQVTNAQAARNMEGLVEREEMFHIQIGGEATTVLTFAPTFDIKFDNVYVDATGQRDSTLEKPTFTSGFYIPQLIAATACVTDWIINQRNETLGCTVRVGFQSDAIRRFAGEFYAVIQGYGAPADVYGDIDATDAG